jgi:hypothetical protein
MPAIRQKLRLPLCPNFRDQLSPLTLRLVPWQRTSFSDPCVQRMLSTEPGCRRLDG